MLEAAAKGNVVIRGWGATQLLRPVPHVPCIRIMRPFDKRVQWLMKQIDTDDRGVAEAEIRRSDQANASRMHDQFGVDWNEPVLFDMVLNTDRLSVDTCVQMIKALLARPEFAETEASRALLQGMALSAHVRAALRADEDTDGVDITIDSQRRPGHAARHRRRRRREGGRRAGRRRRGRREVGRRPAARDVALEPASRRTGSEHVGQRLRAQILPRCFSRDSVSADRLR